MYAVVPVAAFTGLRRCIRARTELKWIFRPSLIGFGFGLAAVLLVPIAIAWGAGKGGFRYYDPALMRFFGIGLLLSLGGLIAGLVGTRKKNLLRWHAPVLSLGMLLLWWIWTLGE